MYATATGSSASMFSARSLSNVYRQIDVETGVSGASSHHLITMLFNGALESISLGKGSMLNNDIETKCRAITKAVRIVEEGLRAGLDMRSGGPLAQQLNELYAYISKRLTLGNLRNDVSALDECVSLLSTVREAWVAIAPAGAEVMRASMELRA